MDYFIYLKNNEMPTMCIVHKGFSGFRAVSPASILGSNLIDKKPAIPYDNHTPNVASNMTNQTQNRITSLKYYLILFLFIGLASCSIIQKPYSITEYKHEPDFRGEIKENNLKGIADTIVVSVNGNVSNFESVAENIELSFVNKKENKTYKTVTDFDGNFKLNIPNGIYKLQVKTYEYGDSKFGTLEFDNLNFEPGELRELKIYTELIGEYVEYETIFKNKRAYNKYIKEQEKK